MSQDDTNTPAPVPRATVERAQALADILLDQLIDILKHGKIIENSEGFAERVRPDAATLNVIRQFLKDHNIGIERSRPNMAKLADILPFKFPFPVPSGPSTES